MEREETATTIAVDVPSVLHPFVLILFIQRDRHVHKTAASLLLQFHILSALRLFFLFFSSKCPVMNNTNNSERTTIKMPQSTSCHVAGDRSQSVQQFRLHARFH